jgi:hypothetical protein
LNITHLYKTTYDPGDFEIRATERAIGAKRPASHSPACRFSSPLAHSVQVTDSSILESKYRITRQENDHIGQNISKLLLHLQKLLR